LSLANVHAYTHKACDDSDVNVNDDTTIISSSKLILVKGVTLMNKSKRMEIAGLV